MDEFNDDKIVQLFKPAEEKKEITADDVLERVKEVHFDRVLVIGIDEDGYLGFASNLDGAESLVYTMERLKHFILGMD